MLIPMTNKNVLNVKFTHSLVYWPPSSFTILSKNRSCPCCRRMNSYSTILRGTGSPRNLGVKLVATDTWSETQDPPRTQFWRPTAFNMTQFWRPKAFLMFSPWDTAFYSVTMIITWSTLIPIISSLIQTAFISLNLPTLRPTRVIWKSKIAIKKSYSSQMDRWSILLATLSNLIRRKLV